MPDAQSFLALFGSEPVVHADAPGRVNLIGEHTDYHEGFVLPCVIPQRTRAELAPRRDRRVRAWSAEIGGSPVEFELDAESRRSDWLDYVQGLTWALARAKFTVEGFDLRLESTVPTGGGLSSSAALEVSVLRALREAFALDLDPVALARLAQRAEVEFVGAPVGIMDQMAASLGREREALFLDTRSLVVESIPLPAAMDLVVIGSGIAHQHASGDYAARRAESEEAARRLGVRVLRNAPADWRARLAELPPKLAARARHVITENDRVHDAVRALKAADLPRLGGLLQASHRSLRDDYQVSVPDVDTLVDIANSDADVYGARMTGGGFGGAIVAVAKRGRGRTAAERIVASYRQRTNRQGDVFLPLSR